MSYEPLHHKYRPQTFKDLVGQDAIAQTLINAITTNRIAPAYLFTGPRGTGKTSSARILAKSLNCLSSDQPTATPCGECDVCRAIARGSALDVIEIDAASNTGVDNIREIIERSQFAPVQCRYKVYVIDECHMLSVAAFNALLKTLEEPPNQVVFVLATTDPQRVLPTIISRCQRFDYRRIPLEDMVKHLKEIASKESIDINEQAITLVSQIANGGLRDAESLLDQLSLLAGTITPDRVWELVGAIPELDLLKLIQAIRSKNPETILECCRHLMNRGKEPLTVLQNLAGFYLNLVIAKTAPNRSDLVAITASTWKDLCQEAGHWTLPEILQGQQHLKDSEGQLKNTTQPRLWLEVTLLGLLSLGILQPPIEQPRETNLPAQSSNGKVHSAPQPIPPQPTVEVTPPEPKTEPIQESPKKEEVTLEQNHQPPSNLDELWKKVLFYLKLPTTQALFSQQGHLQSFDGSVAIVNVNSEKLFKLHQSKIPELEAAFKEIFQKHIKVNIQITKTTQEKLTTNNIVYNPTEFIKEIEQLNPNESTNGNGKTPEPEPQIVSTEPENIIEDSLEISDVSSDSKDEIKIDYSENEVKKAVDIFLKVFEGEIVEEAEKSNQDIVTKTTNNDQKDQIEKQQSESRNTPKIEGRIDLSNVSEDDLEF